MTLAPDVSRALLAPRSVAIFGASDDPGRPAGRPLHYLLRDGFSGPVHPVNPRRTTVQGVTSHARLDDLPRAPDHVFIVGGARTVLEGVEQCARCTVPVATILTDLPARSTTGPSLDEIRSRATAGGVRLLGPNSIGLVVPRSGLSLTANAAFASGPPLPGGIAVASHSGSLIGALATRGAARRVGFSSLISVGAECDITLGEVCAAALDLDGVDTFLLFLEHLEHADDLATFAERAAGAGVPVVAYKLGRSAAGAELSLTHTGALAGDDDVADALLHELGFARVQTLEALVEAGSLAAGIRSPSIDSTPRVGVVTATGGGAAIVVDQLGVRGIDVRGPSAALLDRVRRRAGFPVSEARSIDLTLRGTVDDVMGNIVAEVAQSGEYDLILLVLGSSARSDPANAVRAAIDHTGGTPLAVTVIPDAPEALGLLDDAGVPAFRTPESCADAVAAILGRRPVRVVAARPRPTPTEVVSLDERDAYGIVDVVGVRRAPTTVVDATRPVGTIPVDYPVVAKAIVDGLLHKTEAGGVVLDIGDQPTLNSAVRDLAARTGASRVLVQPQLSPIAEVLVGFRHDPAVGPIVVVSPGGILAELAPTPIIRRAPVDPAEARAMVAACRPIAALLAGHRNRPAGDADALAALISQLSHLADHEHVVEAELNPVIVTESDAVAVDALVRVDAAGGQPHTTGRV